MPKQKTLNKEQNEEAMDCSRFSSSSISSSDSDTGVVTNDEDREGKLAGTITILIIKKLQKSFINN